MGKFGWSYPAGCSGPPDDDRYLPQDIEQILCDLEAAGIPQELCDRIMQKFDELLSKTAQECPICLEAFVNQMRVEDMSAD